MMKTLLATTLLAAGISISAQQVQNPGFETWANSFPTSWGSVGQAALAAFGINPNTEVQTTIKHSGSYAVLLQNQYATVASSNIPGGICTGPLSINSSQQLIRGRQAYSAKPTSYDFWYEFTATGGDTASTNIYLTKWNVNTRDTLAAGGAYIIGAASVYTHQTASINWINSTLTPDSIQLSFYSSIKKVGGTNQPPTGGKLYLDDVNMNLLSGIQSFNFNQENAFAYPNPSSGNITVFSSLAKSKFVKLYDLTGNCIGNYELKDQKASIDLSAFSNGVYMYVITDENAAFLKSAKFNVVK